MTITSVAIYVSDVSGQVSVLGVSAMELDHVGGTFGGNRKPTPFICLVTKMLQIQPDKEIVVEFIKNEDYKYVRALGAFYLRLTATDMDVYRYLEPLYNDYRKLRMRSNDGSTSPSPSPYPSVLCLFLANSFPFHLYRVCSHPRRCVR